VAATERLCLNDNSISIWLESKRTQPLAEDRSARLTILIDPRKKALFETLCADEDQTPSQVVRRLIRAYIEERTGKPWRPAQPKSAAKGKRQS
jgi:hypothetical protein